mgnify:CR=1 FL=1
MGVLYSRLNEKGAILTLFALLLPLIFAITGFAVDIGSFYSTKAHYQNVADAAAYAALTKLKQDYNVSGKMVLNMPIGAKKCVTDFKVCADQAADEYLKKNSNNFFKIEDKDHVFTELYCHKNNDDKYVFHYEVIIKNNLPTHFLKIIYKNSVCIRAGALVSFMENDENG